MARFISLRFQTALWILLSILLYPAATRAQISSDGSLGTLVFGSSNTLIYGGTTAGNNLFHSFDEFSVPTGHTANFVNGAAIQNIFSRVTGGNSSNVDGWITAQHSANLFLLNPAGIIFGPNARLLIGGSFVASTARGVVFAGGSEFTPNSTVSDLLTMSAPSGLNFGSNPGDIVHQGNLRVPAGKAIALIGGNLSLDGGELHVFGGTISLGSVAANSQVGFDAATFEFDYTSAAGFQDITLTDQAQLSTVPFFVGNSGPIQMHGRRLRIEAGSQIQSRPALGGVSRGITLNASESLVIDGIGTLISADEDFIGSAGNITINAPRFLLDNAARLQSGTRLIGAGGNVTINAQQVQLANGAAIDAGTTGLLGHAGNVTIDAQQVQLANGARIDTNTAALGHAGDVAIRAQAVQLASGARINADTTGAGHAGHITVNATESIQIRGVGSGGSAAGIFTDAKETASGDAGNIALNTRSFLLDDRARLETQTAGLGNGGDIAIGAQQVRLDREAGILTNTSGAGRAGSIAINAQQVQLDRAAEISSETAGTGNAGSIVINTQWLQQDSGSQIRSNTTGAGNGGTIAVHAAESIRIQGFDAAGNSSSLLTSTSSSGRGGDIMLNTPQLFLDNRAKINVSAFATGDAGNLEITAGTVALDRGSQLLANVNGGARGNIHMHLGELLLLRRGSQIATNAQGNSTGGNITITIPNGFIIAIPDENSDITANAVAGNGGTIAINARGIFGLEFRDHLTDKSDITANSQFGLSGTVTIATPNVNPAALDLELAGNVLDPDQQVARGCDAVGNSRFVATGRGGLPENPVARRSGTATWDDVRALDAFRQSAPAAAPAQTAAPAPLIEAAGWQVNADGTAALYAEGAAPTDEFATVSCALHAAPES